MHLFSSAPLLFLALRAAYGERLTSLQPRSSAVQCELTDVWPQGPGSSLIPQPPSLDLQQILAQIDPKRIEAIITGLVSFGTRHTLSSQTDPKRGIGAARDWIAAQMQDLAAAAPNGTNATVQVQSFLQSPTSSIPNSTVISNVLGTIQGSDEPNRVYVITGHYDSRVTDIMNFTDDAPGADDDGSGVAVVMELFRIMATRPPPRATIILAAVAGEEQCLCGSTHLAQTLKAAGADVQGMFTNDIVGASKADNGVVDANSIRLFAQGIPSSESAATVATRESIGGENDSPARQLARFVNEVATNDATDMGVRVIYRTDRFLRGGDHEPFLDAGFPAARFTEPNENFAHQHQDVRVDPVTGQQFGDLIEFVDFNFNARVARVNGAAIWSLAQAPGTPKNVTIDTSVLTNNSTLKWAFDISPAVAGYEIVWRATDAPFWSTNIPVGLVSQATVLLSKDNAIMGVRAVGKNGFKSPAAFPFPG
ncbi:Zn-dependent exopeptidase [Auriscalpium vulgare]|uniref:Zn-dependent exopeptidase n=1 Tax=Auriscalpium vulgare TaxID=40419 RepID=A0ACB8S4N5_9AGAM|nr:Zn-dependent exopeptidase [Auriscalpium vulgare]